MEESVGEGKMQWLSGLCCYVCSYYPEMFSLNGNLQMKIQSKWSTYYICTYKGMLTISKKSRWNYFHVIDSKGGNQYSYMHFRAISSNFTSAFLCTNNWDNRQFQFQPMKLNFPFELNAFQMSVTDSSLLTTHTKQFYRVHELLLSLILHILCKILHILCYIISI